MDGFVFKSGKTGKSLHVKESDIGSLHWLRAARGYEVKVITKDGNIVKFDGFRESVSVQHSPFTLAEILERMGWASIETVTYIGLAGVETVTYIGLAGVETVCSTFLWGVGGWGHKASKAPPPNRPTQSSLKDFF